MSDVCSHAPADRRRTPSQVQALVAAAEANWAAEGERMTEPRRRVFEMLLQAGEPVKAYHLMDHYAEGGHAAKPPTVYRALEFLTRKGLVHRIASTNAFVACSSGDVAHTAAFLICSCCGATAEVAPPEHMGLSAAAEDEGFVIDHTTVEILGRCRACR
ncbi:Zinc uptake regulation protein [Brevundimonas sp. NIBR10]|uniref:Fur family transcriptional regulator n=1 Tax=Brevundimonas sp. NIBR10 TaxID=3015997 RepID=UPI0022F1DC6A|nr:Fur family transcriptional regulator [Brevundimonas sp. NIBR10]WGM45880.1 Zinc uptake regulation protein [Brevundimonas sp. NIBR10]